MAYTAGTGFRFYKSLSGNTAAPTPIPVRIANSTTLRIGDVVRVNTSGLLVAAPTTDAAAGVLVGFVDNNGINPFSLGYSKAGVTRTGDDTLATSSTNSTRADYILGEVIVDPAGDILWLNDTSTALTQVDLFTFADSDSSARQLTTNSLSDATGQFQIMMLDPEASGGATADTTKVACRLTRNQFGLLIDSATAKNAA